MENNLKKAQEALKFKEEKINKRYRLGYHIMAPANWINDPNGMCYFNEKYHVFYQHHPYSEQWGPMYWGHVSSEDLINWKHEPIALAPSNKFDVDGCFSGTSAIDPKDGKLIIAYTGHRWIKQKEDLFEQSQCLAYSYDGINFIKEDKRLNIEIPKDSNHHIRDPKLWYHEEIWYMILGNSTKDRDGRALLYESKDLKEWSFKSILARSNGKIGYMFECPDFFKLGDKQVLVFSPQGMKQDGEKYKNFNQSGYLIGEFDYLTGNFDYDKFEELDCGHDFYAPQTLVDSKGRRILIAWMDMWESIMPSQEDGWAGAMTLPRELLLKDNKIIMKPVDELVNLRKNIILKENNIKIHNNEEKELPWEDFMEIEFIINVKENKNIALCFESENSEKSKFIVDLKENSLTLSRNYKTKGIEEDYRKVFIDVLNSENIEFRIFLDKSSIEIFINDGEYVFTSRIYPEGKKAIKLAGDEISLNKLLLYRLSL